MTAEGDLARRRVLIPIGPAEGPLDPAVSPAARRDLERGIERHGLAAEHAAALHAAAFDPLNWRLAEAGEEYLPCLVCGILTAWRRRDSGNPVHPFCGSKKGDNA